MSDLDLRKIIANNWLKKAEESLSEAELLFGGKKPIGCVNRMYYTVFYAVSAALAAEGREYGKHSAVRASVHRDFVKENKIPIEMGILYDELFNDRQAGDYTPETAFKIEDIESLLVKTRLFLQVFANIIN
jgi:uncharacterized protein (UPF0332 family)